MRFKRGAWSVVTAAIILAAGCTGSEVLQRSVNDIGVSAQGSPAGAGRFESATVTVAGVFVEPVDPDAANALVNVPLNLIENPQTFDFAQANEITLSAVTIPSGTYRVTGIRFDAFVFQDTNPPAPPATCLEIFATIPTESFSGIVNAVIFNVDLQTPVTFSVSATQLRSLRIQIDGPAVTSAYLAAIECRQSQFCVATGALPPCLNSFNFPSFETVLASSVNVVVN